MKNTKINTLDILYKDIENNSIKFAQWIANNGYDDMYVDVNNDGKTWVNYENEDKKFTIKELYKEFMIDYLCS